jgi:hypothetical protein
MINKSITKWTDEQMNLGTNKQMKEGTNEQTNRLSKKW